MMMVLVHAFRQAVAPKRRRDGNSPALWGPIISILKTGPGEGKSLGRVRLKRSHSDHPTRRDRPGGGV